MPAYERQYLQQRHQLIRCAFRIPQLDGDLGFRRVYIKPDLSPKEQHADRQLREELKSRRDAGESCFAKWLHCFCHGSIII